MTEFKQIIGRGTRIEEEYDKFFFTIMDFRKATELFADPDFDGDPVVIYEPKAGQSVVPPEDLPTAGGEPVVQVHDSAQPPPWGGGDRGSSSGWGDRGSWGGDRGSFRGGGA